MSVNTLLRHSIAMHPQPGHWDAPSSPLHMCVGEVSFFFVEGGVGALLHTAIVFLKPLQVFTAGRSLVSLSVQSLYSSKLRQGTSGCRQVTHNAKGFQRYLFFFL